MKLFVESDGTAEGSSVLVLGEDGSCLGELESVTGIQWSHVTEGQPQLHLVVLNVPTRYLADKVLIHELKSAGTATSGMTHWLGRSLRRVLRRG